MSKILSSLRSGYLQFFLCFVLLGLTSIAYGQLSDAQPEISMYVQGNTAISESFGNFSYLTGTGTVTGGLDPLVSAGLTTTYNVLIPYNTVDSTLNYSLIIDGPPSMTVPVDVTSILSASFSSDYSTNMYSFVDLEIGSYSASADVYQADQYWTPDEGLSLMLDVNQAIDLTSDTTYGIFLQADTGQLIGSPGTYTSTASVDPMFTIDPSFAVDNPGYHIEYSPNLVPDTTSTLVLLSLSLIASAALLARVRPLFSATQKA